MKVSKIDKENIELVAQVNEELADKLNGWNALALNPIATETFASSSRHFTKQPGQSELDNELGSIQIWKLDENSLTS